MMSQTRSRAVVLAVAVVLTAFLSTFYAPRAGAADISVDDAITTGANSFTYTGNSWTTCGGCNNTATNNSYRYAYTTGDKATFTFTGTQASIYGFKEPAGGIAAISIDGGTTTDTDFYANTQTLTAVFTTPVLTNGQHTITITVTGRKTNGLSPTINIDKAVLTTGTTTPTTTTATPTTTTTPTTATSTTPGPSSQGMASITFDDGTIGQYNYARPALVQRSMKATFYIISDALGWSGTNANAAQVRQLVADGDEIGNHTRDHANLATLTSAQIDAEFADSQRAILSQVGVTPTTCAYPYGSHNAVVDTVASTYFRGCRETGGGTNSSSSLQPYALRNYYVVKSTTADDVRNAALQAKAQNSWVIFTYHGVDPTNAGPEDVTPSQLASQLDAIANAGIPVVTVSQALTAYGR